MHHVFTKLINGNYSSIFNKKRSLNDKKKVRWTQQRPLFEAWSAEWKHRPRANTSYLLIHFVARFYAWRCENRMNWHLTHQAYEIIQWFPSQGLRPEITRHLVMLKSACVQLIVSIICNPRFHLTNSKIAKLFVFLFGWNRTLLYSLGHLISSCGPAAPPPCSCTTRNGERKKKVNKLRFSARQQEETTEVQCWQFFCILVETIRVWGGKRAAF